MSILGDLLTTATPARLLCRRGTWFLELVKLVPVDKNVFQPKVQRLEGSEAVLQHLKRNSENPSLAAAATQLMRGLRPDEDRSFEAVDGDWVPGEPGPRRDSTRPSAPPPGANVAGELAELRAELLILRASHERLRERVMRLESSSASSGSMPPRELISLVHTPSVSVPYVSEPPRVSDAPRGPEPFAATLAQGREPATQAARAHSGPSASPAVVIPTVDAIKTSLRAMIGDPIDAREASSTAFSATAAGPCWVSRLIDDEGREVGAIVADLQATTGLGGALLNLEPSDIEAQRAGQAPSEDVIAAMNEVANHLSGTINQEPGGAQVRVKPIEPLTPALLDWAKTPRQCVGVEVVADGGRLFLLAR